MKSAVVFKDLGEIYQVFEDRAEANYCVTDTFGPEWDKVTIVEVPDHAKCGDVILNIAEGDECGPIRMLIIK